MGEPAASRCGRKVPLIALRNPRGWKLSEPEGVSAVQDQAHTKAHGAPYHQAKLAAPQSGSNAGTIVLIVFVLLAVIGLAGLGYWIVRSRSKSVKGGAATRSLSYHEIVTFD